MSETFPPGPVITCGGNRDTVEAVSTSIVDSQPMTIRKTILVD